MRKEKSYKKFEELIRNKALSEKEISELKDIYESIEELEVPEPSESMQSNFYNQLENYKLKRSGSGLKISWPDLHEVFGLRTFVLKPAFAVLLFLIGIITGLLIKNQPDNSELITELQNSQKALMLTLIEQPSATARLKAVNLTNDLSGPDEVVINALFTTLNNDDNVNVRLAALEALFNYSNLPQVRKGLVESIAYQKSPLVLVTLSKAMVLLQEKGSAEKLRQLLEEHDFEKNIENKIVTIF